MTDEERYETTDEVPFIFVGKRPCLGDKQMRDACEAGDQRLAEFVNRYTTCFSYDPGQRLWWFNTEAGKERAAELERLKEQGLV
jgi:hypothetical protein